VIELQRFQGRDAWRPSLPLRFADLLLDVLAFADNSAL